MYGADVSATPATRFATCGNATTRRSPQSRPRLRATSVSLTRGQGRRICAGYGRRGEDVSGEERAVPRYRKTSPRRPRAA